MTTETVDQTTFEQRARIVAAGGGFAFPLLEDELVIGEIVFYKDGKEFLTVPAGDGNRTSRMWLETITLSWLLDKVGNYDTWDAYCSDLKLTSTTEDERTMAQNFFGAELWKEASAERHLIIYGFQEADAFSLTLKPNAERILLPRLINAAWEGRETINTESEGPFVSAIYSIIDLVNQGKLRAAEPSGDEWLVNDWVKKAMLLFFRIQPNDFIEGADGPSWDKVPLKCSDWQAEDFEKAGFRLVPSAVVRSGCYIGPKVILMFNACVNMGAYVGEGTMIDGGARVGSCAQVGKNCHISGGAGIGGVFEPLQATPTIIGDGVFLGPQAEVAEGVIVGDGAVIAGGQVITASTKIIDRKTGEFLPSGRIPPYSVVVEGSYPDVSGLFNITCAIIAKQVDERTRSKTSVNELLRD